jgi:hypothetical protein
MRIAVLLVGHANFGKSRTLVKLSGSKNSRSIYIANKRFALQRKSNGDLNNYEFILQRKSNGDIGYVFKEKVDEYIHQNIEYLLLTFCPDFDDMYNYSEAVLKLLKENNYKIYSFVLKQKFNGNGSVKKSEIRKLEEYCAGIGDCKGVRECDATDEDERAKELKGYIEDIILAEEIFLAELERSGR